MRVQQRTAELRAAVGDLSEEIAERQRVAERLQRREAQLRDAVRARDEVLGVVAHDLRTPIAAAQLATSTIVRVLPEEDPPTPVRKMALGAERALQRATHLIRDLLDVARIEGRTLAVEPRPVAARELIVEVTDALAAVASQKALELQADVEERLPPVLADSWRIFQVFSNLVDNAAKFAPSGSRVRIGAHRADDDVCFSVTDTGVGIDAEDVPHLFDRFWQHRRGDQRGAGLGLAIAKGIIDAHGGRIWVESTPGVGSTFYFTIPVARADDGSREAVAHADGPMP